MKNPEKELIQEIARCTDDPLRFVLLIFPWGEGVLKEDSGPDVWQAETLKSIGKHCKDHPEEALRMATASGHGIGKALSKRTIIHTPDGLKKWGELKVGDKVFAGDGSPTKISAVFDQGIRKIFRITFDDGSSVEADGDHLWKVKGRNNRRTASDWSLMTTSQILKSGVKRLNGNSKARQWEIPVQGEVQFPSQKIPIHPYTLGVWLGDGGRNSGRITSIDNEVIGHLRDVGETVNKGVGYSWGILGLKKKLSELGVLLNYSYQKSVPVCYLENSTEVRSEILRGLLDTDGECTKQGSIIFNSTSRTLAEDVLFLVRSLGGKARIQPTVKRPKFRDSEGNLKDGLPCWRATLTMPHEFQSFYVSRKQKRVKNVESRYLSRWIDRIEEIEEMEAMCITVDHPSSCFLANDFIVTHNSALVAWIILWFISTREHPQIIVTANTLTQLNSKTWRELAKWHKLALNKSWFAWTATKFYVRQHPETWFATAIPWSKDNPEAFAGTHEKHVLVVYDEASGVADIIWEVTEGAMTTPGAMWFAFGNPTKNSGRFKECFGKFKHRWLTKQVDSRQAKKADKKQLQQWVDDYGEDSDFVRVRVRGVFPRSGSEQFISNEIMDFCKNYQAADFEHMPKILGVDVARFGDNQTVIAMRQGRKIYPFLKYRGLDTQQVASRVAEMIEDHEPQVVFIDGGGVGGGVIDRLKTLGYGLKIVDVQSGMKADDSMKYYNKRAEMWGRMREALKQGMELPEDRDFWSEITSVEYAFSDKNQIQIEKKTEMRSRGLESPDTADGLALTFAQNVSKMSKKLYKDTPTFTGREGWMM